MKREGITVAEDGTVEVDPTNPEYGKPVIERNMRRVMLGDKQFAIADHDGKGNVTLFHGVDDKGEVWTDIEGTRVRRSQD